MHQVSTSINQEGKKVRHFKHGKLTINATYTNKPSEQAIQNFNKIYNEHFVSVTTVEEEENENTA